MTDDPWPRPTRSEPRCDFPAHDDLMASRPVLLTLAAARRAALHRLEQWRRDHE